MEVSSKIKSKYNLVICLDEKFFKDVYAIGSFDDKENIIVAERIFEDFFIFQGVLKVIFALSEYKGYSYKGFNKLHLEIVNDVSRSSPQFNVLLEMWKILSEKNKNYTTI